MRREVRRSVGLGRNQASPEEVPSYYLKALMAIGIFAGLLSFLIGMLFGWSSDTLSGDMGGALALLQHGQFEWVRDLPGGRFPTVRAAYRAPGFATALAAWVSLFGQSKFVLASFQALCVTATTLSTAWIGRILGGARVGLVAGVVAAVVPYSLFHSQSMIDTPIFTALLIFSIACCLANRSWWIDVMGATALSMAVLTRANAAVLVGVVLVWLMWNRRFRTAAIYSSIVSLLVGAWCLFLWYRLGGFAFVSTNGGWNLWLGNNDLTFHYLLQGRSLDRIEDDGLVSFSWVNGMSETREDQAFRMAAIGWIIAHPLAAARTWSLKAGLTILPILQPMDSIAKTVAIFVTTVPLYVGTAFAAFTRKRRGSGLLLALIGASILMNIVFLPYLRIFSPVFPLMAILTVFALFDAHSNSRVE